MRRAWPAVLEEVKGRRKFTYMLLSGNAQVSEVRDGMLVLAFSNPGARDNFSHGGSLDLLVDAIIEVLGVELRVQGVVGEPATQPEPGGQRPAGRPARAEESRRAEPPSGPPPAPEPDYSQFSADDEAFDGVHNAEELLGRELGAEIISVEEDGARDE